MPETDQIESRFEILEIELTEVQRETLTQILEILRSLNPEISTGLTWAQEAYPNGDWNFESFGEQAPADPALERHIQSFFKSLVGAIEKATHMKVDEALVDLTNKAYTEQEDGRIIDLHHDTGAFVQVWFSSTAENSGQLNVYPGTFENSDFFDASGDIKEDCEEVFRESFIRTEVTDGHFVFVHSRCVHEAFITSATAFRLRFKFELTSS